MASIRIIPFILLLFLFSAFCAENYCIENWKLVKNSKDIKVFTRRPSNSSFDEVKVETKVKAKLSQVVALIEDLDAQPNWVYATKGVSLLETRAPGDYQFQYYMDMPFPVKDRDVIIDYKRSQNVDTKTVTIVSKATRSGDLITDNFVRILDFQSSYTLTPLANGNVEIVYQLNANPGSNMPAWIINMFTTTGPFKSMAALVKLLKEGSHSDKKVEDLIH